MFSFPSSSVASATNEDVFYGNFYKNNEKTKSVTRTEDYEAQSQDSSDTFEIKGISGGELYTSDNVGSTVALKDEGLSSSLTGDSFHESKAVTGGFDLKSDTDVPVEYTADLVAEKNNLGEFSIKENFGKENNDSSKKEYSQNNIILDPEFVYTNDLSSEELANRREMFRRMLQRLLLLFIMLVSVLWYFKDRLPFFNISGSLPLESTKAKEIGVG